MFYGVAQSLNFFVFHFALIQQAGVYVARNG